MKRKNTSISNHFIKVIVLGLCSCVALCQEWGGHHHGRHEGEFGGGGGRFGQTGEQQEEHLVLTTETSDALAKLLKIDVSSLPATAAHGTPCQDPNGGREGICSYITDPQCLPLRNGLSRDKQRQYELTLKYVRKAVATPPCGYDGVDLTLCCLERTPERRPHHEHKHHDPPQRHHQNDNQWDDHRDDEHHHHHHQDEWDHRRPEQDQHHHGERPGEEDKDKTETNSEPPPTPTPLPPTMIGEHCGIRKVAGVAAGKVSKRSIVKRTIGGIQAPDGHWPWAAILGQPAVASTEPMTSATMAGFRVICGGTLVTSQHVLTAAHCFPPNAPAAQNVTHVHLGEQDLGETEGKTPVNAEICEVLKHEDFKEDTAVENDVAVVRLCRPVEFGTYIQPACLPPPMEAPTGNLTVVGWGSDHVGGGPVNNLQEADVVIVPLDECQKEYSVIGGNIDDSHICAGKGMTDTCAGDSGGPMMTTIDGAWTVVGITSFGVGCANEKFPGVYTNVAQFLPWIKARLT